MAVIGLKSMENGALGEARAKAFLLDRFWVLERSVDIQGADFLIQRRLTEKNFLDYSPPRLGVVQVKFIQDEKTSISIPEGYVQDSSGVAYDEFFLLVFTGNEDREKIYFFSAQDIQQKFQIKSAKGKSVFKIAGRVLLACTNNEVKSKRLTLGVMEHALVNSDFRRNRRFLGRSGHISISPDEIDADFKLPVANSYGNIQRSFYAQKEAARDVLWELDEARKALHDIMVAKDPVAALDIYEEKLSDFIDGQDRLSFSMREVWNEELANAAQRHTAHLERVSELGMKSGYSAIISSLDDEIRKYIDGPQNPANKGTHISLSYDRQDLGGAVIRIVEESMPCTGTPSASSWAQIVASSRGHHEVCYDKSATHRVTSGYDASKSPHTYMRAIQGALDMSLFGEEPDL